MTSAQYPLHNANDVEQPNGHECDDLLLPDHLRECWPLGAFDRLVRHRDLWNCEDGFVCHIHHFCLRLARPTEVATMDGYRAGEYKPQDLVGMTIFAHLLIPPRDWRCTTSGFTSASIHQSMVNRSVFLATWLSSPYTYSLPCTNLAGVRWFGPIAQYVCFELISPPFGTTQTISQERLTPRSARRKFHLQDFGH